MKKVLIAGISALVLAACGGGGSDSKDVSPTEKFIGDYSLCDGEHIETFTTVRSNGGDNLTFKWLQIGYANADCSGTKVVWVDYKVPSLFSYKTKYSEHTVYGLVSSAEWSTADVVSGTLVHIAQMPEISGSAIVGQDPGCFKIAGTIHCYDPLNAGVIDNNGYVLSNGVLYSGVRKTTYSGNPYFDLVKLGIKRY
jgi:hypothetical protein